MPAHPDLIVRGARVRTLDPELPACSALAIKDGLIAATGDDVSIRALRGAGTRVIDGCGIAFVPGLTDSHIHPLMGTLRTQGVHLPGFTADLAETDADALLDLPVLMTVVAGRVVHEAR